MKRLCGIFRPNEKRSGFQINFQVAVYNESNFLNLSALGAGGYRWRARARKREEAQLTLRDDGRGSPSFSQEKWMGRSPEVMLHEI